MLTFRRGHHSWLWLIHQLSSTMSACFSCRHACLGPHLPSCFPVLSQLDSAARLVPTQVPSGDQDARTHPAHVSLSPSASWEGEDRNDQPVGPGQDRRKGESYGRFVHRQLLQWSTRRGGWSSSVPVTANRRRCSCERNREKANPTEPPCCVWTPARPTSSLTCVDAWHDTLHGDTAQGRCQGSRARIPMTGIAKYGYGVPAQSK